MGLKYFDWLVIMNKVEIIEGNLLDPFKENPYTQSLASFAY